MSGSLFPAKPFLVIAEDSNGRFVTTDRKVVDAIWNFGYRNEIRRLVTNNINTSFGQPSRSERVQHLISKDGVWNDWNHSFAAGYSDLARSWDHGTSHDVRVEPSRMTAI